MRLGIVQAHALEAIAISPEPQELQTVSMDGSEATEEPRVQLLYSILLRVLVRDILVSGHLSVLLSRPPSVLYCIQHGPVQEGEGRWCIPLIYD